MYTTCIPERNMSHLDYKQEENCGETFEPKEVNDIRIVSKKINGTRGITLNNYKETWLKQLIVNKYIDILGVQEVNMNWTC